MIFYTNLFHVLFFLLFFLKPLSYTFLNGVFWDFYIEWFYCVFLWIFLLSFFFYFIFCCPNRINFVLVKLITVGMNIFSTFFSSDSLFTFFLFYLSIVYFWSHGTRMWFLDDFFLREFELKYILFSNIFLFLIWISKEEGMYDEDAKFPLTFLFKKINYCTVYLEKSETEKLICNSRHT